MSGTDANMLASTVREIIQRFGGKSTNLVQMLWEVQDQYSCIADAAIDCIADEMKMTRAYVAGVAEFYSFFHKAPRGQYDILFSNNITDRMLGKQEVMDYLMRKLGVEVGKPRADGRVTVDNTSCIGMSDQGPAALVNGYTLTHLTKTKVNKIVSLIEAQTPLKEWPESYFEVAKNIQRKHILLGEAFEPGSAIKVLLERGNESLLTELAQSSLRGCGGAGFRVDSKWMICRNAPGDEHFVTCNADEGEPGTFKDRVLLQSYTDLVFEGMTLCARIIGAKKGFLYLRGEYRYLLKHLQAVLARRREENLLGQDILGTPGFNFDIEIHLGAGAYICGAETAMIQSLEGRRGVPRKRPPPFPVTQGYLGKPTVVNNVESFALAAKIFIYGYERFTALGTAQSKGTKLISVSGDCDRPGIYEFPFGVTVREVLNACGAHEPQAVQNSGPAGICVHESEFDRRLCFEDINTTGSFMVFNRQRDMLEVIHNFADFFVHESCGFCTPCRVGTSLVRNLVDKIAHGRGSANDLNELTHLSHIIRTSAHCGLGMTATNHITDTLKKFRYIYERRLKTSSLTPTFELDDALNEARQLTARTDEAAHLEG